MTEELPEFIGEIAEVAGIDAAWAIAIAKGGQQVFIPAYASEGHWLADLVGMDAAKRICDHFRVNWRGDKHIVPMANNARRRVALQQAIAGAQTVDKAAAAAGVHRRTVFRYRRKGKANSDQGSLF